ncbi:hypothetical protein CRENBAI_001439 [Crenichthys baileyi]|uniref:Uncharacterized protein n=1 Tax=Crenichthys baileyi TaxID=28760 RepID=A0AAV9RVN7_9TELE
MSSRVLMKATDKIPDKQHQILSREESEATEASASDQDDGEPVPGDPTDLFPAVSSTAFAPLKGPSGYST